jgi:RNA polymerase sporulation-specific sigma factor
VPLNKPEQRDILDNMKLVYQIAHLMKSRHTNSLMDFDDLVSVGTFGLYRAFEGYDPDKGTTFRTYAGTCIRYAMIDAHRNAYKQYRQARRCGLPTPSYLYLDADSYEDGSSNHDLVSDRRLNGEDALIEKIDATLVWKRVWRQLQPVERQIMKLMRQGVSQVEIALAVGISKGRVSQRYLEILGKVRDYHGIQGDKYHERSQSG